MRSGKQHTPVVEIIHFLPYSLKLSAKFMKFRSCWLIFTLIGLSLTSCGQQKSSQEIAETVKNSIVLISYQNESGHGTGFIVPGPAGVCTVLTARHVVEGRSLNLQTNDQKLHKTDSIQASPNFDLAVVRFKSVGETCPYPSLNLGDSNTVKVGDKIYISGFPNDRADSGKLRRQFVGGFVSGFEVLENGYGLSYDARVENGMSGGPVLDVNGKVVAVHGLFYKGFPWGIIINIYKQNQSNWVNQPTPKADSTKQENKSDLVNQPIAKANSLKDIILSVVWAFWSWLGDFGISWGLGIFVCVVLMVRCFRLDLGEFGFGLGWIEKKFKK